MKVLKTDLKSDTPFALICRMIVSVIVMCALTGIILVIIPYCGVREYAALLAGFALSVFLIVSSYITVKNSVEVSMKRPVAYTRSWMLGRYLLCAVVIAALTYFDFINPVVACVTLLTYNLSAYTQSIILKIIVKRGAYSNK